MLNFTPKHSLLRRQLRRHLAGAVPPPEKLAALLRDVDEAYTGFDGDRLMLERSLELSSQELLQANAEMSAVFRALPDLLFRVDAAGRILSSKTGKGGEPLLRTGALPGRLLQETALLPASANFTNVLSRVLAEKTVRTLDFVGAGERPEAYEARFVPVQAGEALVIIRNITDRKRAEAALRSIVSLQNATFESTADGILVVDLARRIVSFNGRFAAMWKLPDGVRIGGDERTLAAALAAQLGEPGPYLEGVERLYAEPEAEVHDEVRLRDGRIYERFTCPQRLEGRPVGRVWSFRDVTGRVQAEQALLAEQERFRLVALATRDAIYDWNMVTGTIWRNDVFQSIHAGGRDRERESLLWEDFVHPDDLKRVKQSMADALVGGKRLWSQEYRFARADGTHATVIDRGHIVYNAEGRPVRMIGAMTDISEHKRLEEQFLQSQKMEAIGRLAGGVAHDFNNLLTVIQGNLSMLRQCALTPAEAATAMEECYVASQRAANLTRQLLTFSRREPVELKPLDLNEVVAEMTRMFRRLVGEHIQIQTSFAPGGMPVLADAGMIEQLLMNLVVNSRDAMPRGGQVSIETGAETLTERDAATRAGARPGRFVRLRVSDTGCGIPPEHLPRIFEPFFTTKSAGQGTGLGLATVFGIVQQHQGWIEVSSAPGQGTAFKVFLPRFTAAIVTRDEAGDESAPSGNGEKILIVEDEELIRRWMSGVLARRGYEVHAVGSGPEALEFHRQNPARIDLLVTDMVMPEGISGRELGQRLVAERPGLKVLHCSGYTDEFLGPDAPRRDSIDFLAKPFDMTTLLCRIRQRLDAP